MSRRGRRPPSHQVRRGRRNVKRSAPIAAPRRAISARPRATRAARALSPIAESVGHAGGKCHDVLDSRRQLDPDQIVVHISPQTLVCHQFLENSDRTRRRRRRSRSPSAGPATSSAWSGSREDRDGEGLRAASSMRSTSLKRRRLRGSRPLVRLRTPTPLESRGSEHRRRLQEHAAGNGQDEQFETRKRVVQITSIAQFRR